MDDPSQPQKFGPVGQCIYCGCTDELSIEHIVPKGLGGRYELHGASCEACGGITSNIEGIVMRGLYHAPRARLGLLSKKRKNEHPAEWPVEIDFGTSTEPKAIPIAEHPTVLIGPVLSVPTILLGIPKSEDTRLYLATRPLNPDRDAVRVLGPNVKVSARYDGIAYARMLAKIGHAYAWAKLGHEFKPILNDLILNKPQDFPIDVIGGTMELPAHGTQLHEIELLPEWEGYLVVRLRLFSALQMPIYYVVVGKP